MMVKLVSSGIFKCFKHMILFNYFITLKNKYVYSHLSDEEKKKKEVDSLIVPSYGKQS